MENIFTRILNMTFEASWLILAVIVIRLLLKTAPKWIRCVMWAMVGLKLALPFTIESSLSLIPDTQDLQPVTENVSTQTATTTESFSVMPIIALVWAIGVAIMLGYMVFSYIHLKRKVRESIPIEDNVMLCDNIASPFVLGFISPKIYLIPSMTESEKEYVLAHEKAHLKRGDNLWKPLGFLMLSVYWFNPLCWVAYWLFNKDIELACDEKVIRNLDNKGRKAYSTALLICNSGRHMVTACPVAFGENNVKSRIKSVLSYKKPTVYIMTFAVVLCSVVAVGFMTSPETQAKEPEKTVVVTEPVAEKATETEPVTEKVTETTEPPTEATTKPVETAPETVATTAPTQATTSENNESESSTGVQPSPDSEAYKKYHDPNEIQPTPLQPAAESYWLEENIKKNKEILKATGGGGFSNYPGQDTFRNKNIINEPIAWDIVN